MSEEVELYDLEDISFVNTSEFSRAAAHFKKYGCYTKAHPIYDKEEYDAYWDEEEKRRLYGMTLPGKYVNGKIQKVHITGEHYGYLNYAQILMGKLSKEDAEESILKDVKKSTVKTIEFPDFWDGDYHFFKAKDYAKKIGKNLCVAKARRKGYSYKNAWCCANKYDLYPNTTCVIGAFDSKYLIKGDGTMIMAKNYLDFLNKETDWYKSRLVNTKEHIKSGYKERGKDEEFGFKSQIIAVSFQNNPDAAIGKDAIEILLEEAGKFPNLCEALDVTLPTIEDGNIVSGQIIVFGTGGTKDSNWEAFETVFYECEKYNMLPFNNIWDEGMQNTPCGYFVPHIQNLKPYIDAHGNSLKEKALKSFTIEKANKKKTVRDISTYNTWVGQRANQPKEAFLRNTDNIFSSQELSDHIEYVKTSKEVRDVARIGTLVNGEKGIVFKQTDKHLPVIYPHKKTMDLTGCVIEWIPPFKNNGIVPSNLYTICNDPFGIDKDNDFTKSTDSLGASYVIERSNLITPGKGDMIVACYVGRPERQDDYNEILLKLSLYYNAEVMFENDRGDVKNYFKRNQALNMLCDEPEILWKKELQGKSGRNKGISMNLKRKADAALYLKDWLYTKRGTNHNGDAVLNLDYIYDLELLKELEKWNLKGNFDRVSALLVGQFHMKEIESREIEGTEVEDRNSFFNRTLF